MIDFYKHCAIFMFKKCEDVTLLKKEMFHFAFHLNSVNCK